MYNLTFNCTGGGVSGRDDRVLSADLQYCPWSVQGQVRLQRQHDRRHYPASDHGPER